MSIAAHIALVRARIDAAARRVGRDPDEVALMCVTKTQPASSIIEAWHAGARLFGENRVQEFAARSAALEALQGAEFRLIGHLQSNKAAKAAQIFHGVDSLDSLRTAEKLNDACRAANQVLPVLVEVNSGNQAAKSGVRAESAELESLLSAIPRLQHLAFRGLMTIPPYSPDSEDSRIYFRALRKLRDQIAVRGIAGISWDVLSMGMSGDFEVAIEEGSTCVRVGTAIFGAR